MKIDIKTDRRDFHLLLGLGLGYVINFVIAVLAISAFGINFFFDDITDDFRTILEISFYVGFYGMGVGLLTEMLFKDKTWASKLPIYFLAILFSPLIIILPLLSFIAFIGQGNMGDYFGKFILSLPLCGVLATSIYMYFKSFKGVEIFTYVVGYIFIFLGILFALFFSEIINIEGIMSFMIVCIFFILLFPVIGVGLCKSFFRWVYNEKR